MIKTLLLSIGLLFVAVIAMGVKIWLLKDGRFPSGHVHDIKALKGKGVKCGRDQ